MEHFPIDRPFSHENPPFGDFLLPGAPSVATLHVRVAKVAKGKVLWHSGWGSCAEKILTTVPRKSIAFSHINS